MLSNFMFTVFFYNFYTIILNILYNVILIITMSNVYINLLLYNTCCEYVHGTRATSSFLSKIFYSTQKLQNIHITVYMFKVRQSAVYVAILFYFNHLEVSFCTSSLTRIDSYCGEHP